MSSGLPHSFQRLAAAKLAVLAYFLLGAGPIMGTITSTP